MSIRMLIMNLILLPVLAASGIFHTAHTVTSAAGDGASGLLQRGSPWETGGNNNIGAGQFIGTVNRQDFRIHVAAAERAVFAMDGKVGINVNPPTKQLDVRFTDRLLYEPMKWQMDGMLLLNDWKTPQTGHGAALTFAAIGGPGSHLARAMITGQVTGADRMDIVFQNECNPPDVMRESMRITADGYVGIGTGINRPQRPLHTAGTIRFSALEYGEGDMLVVDANGDVYRSSSSRPSQEMRRPDRDRDRYRDDRTDEIELLERRIKLLEADIIELRRLVDRR